MIEVSKFQEAFLYASIRNWTIIDPPYELIVSARLCGVVDGIKATIPQEQGNAHYFRVRTGVPQPYNATGRYALWAPIIQIDISLLGYRPEGYTGTVLLSVSLYLRG